MTLTPPDGVDRGRRGIALIIVLGFLAIVVLLGVSFAILMRTERLAARSYVDGVRAKQMTQVAIARAMADLDAELYGRSLLAPDWVAFESFSPTGTVDYCDDLFSGAAVSNVPTALRSQVATVAPGAHWINVSTPVGGPHPVEVVGRYAYVAVDCSKFLDANSIGQANRETQLIPAALDPSPLPEFTSVGGVGNFLNERNTRYIRFENMHELALLTEWHNPDLMAQPIQNFFTYSRALPDYRVISPVQVAPQLDLTNEIQLAVENANWTTIRDTLAQCSVPNPDKVVLNLADYVDADLIPNGGGVGDYVDDFMTEPVPMINEVVVSNWLEVATDGSGDTTYKHTIYIVVETWYPFDATTAQNSPDFSVHILNAAVPAQRPAAPSITPGPLTSKDGASWKPAAYSFKRHEFAFDTVNVTASGPVPPEIRTLVRVQGIEVRMGGTPVDRVPTLPDDRFVLRHDTSQPSAAAAATSCADPRINWVPNHWPPNISHTMYGEQPQPYRSTNATAVVQTGEWPSPMFVRNAMPSNVFELGFLSVGQPWRTISLYEDPSRGVTIHPVVDYFRIGPTPTNAIKGLVSLNSGRGQVMGVPFYKAPLRRYPEENGAPTVDWNAALNMGRALTNRVHRNLSEIGAVGTAIANANPGWPDALRESMIGNTYPLMTIRQNVFTLLLASQSVQDGNRDGIVTAGEIVGEQRALAILWRDPYPRVAPDYEYPYVRFFKWLYD